jgi:hypothetical protein
MAARRWTEAQRQAAATRIRAQKPWTRSTGPRSTDGKAAASRNAVKHGFRSRAMRDLYKAMADLGRLRRWAVRDARLRLALARLGEDSPIAGIKKTGPLYNDLKKKPTCAGFNYAVSPLHTASDLTPGKADPCNSAALGLHRTRFGGRAGLIKSISCVFGQALSPHIPKKHQGAWVARHRPRRPVGLSYF